MTDDPMTDTRLERLAGLAELPCSCGVADCENFMSALTREQAQDLVAEAKRARAELTELRKRLGAPREEWGYAYADFPNDVMPVRTEAAARDVVAKAKAICGSAISGEPRIMHRYAATGPWQPVDSAEQQRSGDGAPRTGGDGRG